MLGRLLKDRRVLGALLVLYLVVAAVAGGPWFAFFSGGLAALVAGFVWAMSRSKRTSRLGVGVSGLGVAAMAFGYVLGAYPELFYREAPPVVAMPAPPALPVEVVPSPQPRWEVTPAPTPAITAVQPRAARSSVTSPVAEGPVGPAAPRTQQLPKQVTRPPQPTQVLPQPTQETQPEPTQETQPEPTQETQPEPTQRAQPNQEPQPEPTQRAQPNQEPQPEQTQETQPDPETQPTQEVQPTPSASVAPDPLA